MNLLETLREPLAREGLNHLGVVSRARYDRAAPPELRADRMHPPTRSILVVGSGGRAHWEAFLEWVDADPVRRLAQTDHPLDDFTAAVLARLGPQLEGCRVVFPTFDAPAHFDFVRLAELAGLGTPSEVGVLISERFGLWFALRAAIFAPCEMPESREARAMCEGCHAPCRAACPASIVGPPPFPWLACAATRERPNSPCRTRCAARERCIVAPELRYDDLELLYHYDRPAGRRALCARFGVADERPQLG